MSGSFSKACAGTCEIEILIGSDVCDPNSVCDLTPPDTILDSAPASPANTASAAFAFSGNDVGGSGLASFEYKLDSSAWLACTSPIDYANLSDGIHTYSVLASDNAGNVMPTPVTHIWQVIKRSAPSSGMPASALFSKHTSECPDS